ncbi:hypothetical protein ACIRJS_45010 [Streptomyces sp. NPDC102340]|uniref:hypothetical protein n=1 Tax=unclassified Streptomyces TaxID=2593676 RepID=UPI00381C9534
MLERWIEQARKTVNPVTGRPYLPAYFPERHAPLLEGRYPGAKVTATVTAQEMGQPGNVN